MESLIEVYDLTTFPAIPVGGRPSQPVTERFALHTFSKYISLRPPSWIEYLHPSLIGNLVQSSMPLSFVRYSASFSFHSGRST